ncbi:MAG: DUF3501 family protein [Vicinamibacteria bacterium]|jgi:hypothetical protein|nr:DUF3501 family protein [Vicinamibacteria bacterium]MBP9948013.1 DUF3501 family protein [Vicinamibacteria bacterium]
MKEIELKDIRNIAEYEKVRESMRADIIALKKNRRLVVGPNLSLVFENRETVLFQIHEMVRTERLVDDRKIQDEIDAYKNLVPRPGELSATMFIEIPGITEMSHAKAIEAVNFFQGFDAGGIVLEVGDARSAAVFESGFSNDEKMAAVQYLKFPVDESMAAALQDVSRAALLRADNGRYRASAEIGTGMRQELIRDLD